MCMSAGMGQNGESTSSKVGDQGLPEMLPEIAPMVVPIRFESLRR